MRHLTGTLLLSAALLLAGCASSGYDEDDQFTVESHCRYAEDLDEYDNPDGWDRCVEDNLPQAAEYNDCADEQGLDDADVLTREYRRIDRRCTEQVGWIYP